MKVENAKKSCFFGKQRKKERFPIEKNVSL